LFVVNAARHVPECSTGVLPVDVKWNVLNGQFIGLINGHYNYRDILMRFFKNLIWSIPAANHKKEHGI
jgi:hypothetical protein